jgi:hypothetical protein
VRRRVALALPGVREQAPYVAMASAHITITGIPAFMCWSVARSTGSSPGPTTSSTARRVGELETPDCFARICAALMGRRTHDVVCGMTIPWPTARLTATHSP